MIRSVIWWMSYPVLSRIRTLEDMYKGQDCYIFGDGSSIKYFQLSKFGDKVGIAVNAFPRHKDANLTLTKFWVVAEAGFFLPPIFKTSHNRICKFKNRKRFQSFFKHRAIDAREMIHITSLANFPFKAGPRTYYFWDRLPRRKEGSSYTSSKESFAGSVCAAITIAQYLGFKRAYLVGFDYTHNPKTSHHWYERVTPIKSKQVLGEYHSEFFEDIQKFIEVITVTPTDQETELASISYQDLCNTPLNYRENVELLSESDLEILSLNTDYKIFGESPD